MKADEALSQISYMRELIDQTRLRAAHGYPYFLVWGLAWIVGYAGSLRWPYIWGLVLPAGGVASLLVAWLRRGPGSRSPLAGRIDAANGILFGAALAASLLLISDNQASRAFWPIAIGTIYLVNAVFIGWELAAIGAWTIAAGAVSFLMPEVTALIWLAAAGGGSLLLTGFLLRRQLHKS